jgi:hypothetical protein
MTLAKTIIHKFELAVQILQAQKHAIHKNHLLPRGTHCVLPTDPCLHNFMSSQQNTDENNFFSLNIVMSSFSLRVGSYVGDCGHAPE